MSHDFVEAGLLRRAGWSVRFVPRIQGSYEETPPTLIDHILRDRRWCQGNLQHLRIALAEGLLPMSRIHMWIGVSAYLAGPVWLGFVGLGAWLASQAHGPLLPHTLALGLSGAAATLIVGPRLLGLLDTCRTSARRAAHGGAVLVLLGVLGVARPARADDFFSSSPGPLSSSQPRSNDPCWRASRGTASG